MDSYKNKYRANYDVGTIPTQNLLRAVCVDIKEAIHVYVCVNSRLCMRTIREQ